MSKRIDTKMANAKAAASWSVNATVWVMKPGPMAEVAIRNMAPRNLRRPLSWGSGTGSGPVPSAGRTTPCEGAGRSMGVCDMRAPGVG